MSDVVSEPRRTDVLELAKHLIAIESHSLAAGRESEIGRFLVAWFADRGIEVTRQPVADGRANVVARLRGGGGPSLMLCGHLDTVPGGGMGDPFTPRVRNGTLWGRGACDMKGAVAAMCCAVAAVGEASPRLAGDLTFAGTVDEETGGLGVKGLIEAGVRAHYAVVGEPTRLRVALAHKGACFLRLTLRGRAAHGSCPEQGVSAVSYAARIVRAIEDELRSKLAVRTHPLLGASTVSVGRVCGGTQPNIVADTCEIDVDRRTVPGDDDPVGELRSLVARICDGADGLAYEVAEMPMTSVVPHTPLETPTTSPVAEAAMVASAQAAGLSEPEAPIGVAYWTDGSHLADHGIETIVLGPGDIAHAHGPEDRVEIGELERAADVYRRIALRLLSDAGGAENSKPT